MQGFYFMRLFVLVLLGLSITDSSKSKRKHTKSEHKFGLMDRTLCQLEKCLGETQKGKDPARIEAARKALKSETKHGKQLCHYTKQGVGTFAHKCEVECYDHEVAEDQLKCACDACQNNTKISPRNFCKTPGGEPLQTKKDCQDTVCRGYFKYRGEYCGGVDLEELRRLL